MLVSVLIPCFNGGRWLAQAIQSALDQTWADKEILIVDDGSVDGSLDIIRSFGARVQWESGPNRGGNVARNRLLQVARGEWLQYLDADDYLLPRKIERQAAFLAGHPNCDVVYGPVYRVHWAETRVTQEIITIPEPHDPWLLLARGRLPETVSPLWRRQTLLEVGGWKPDQPCCQEYELYLRLLQHGARFRYVGECLAAYRLWSQDTVSQRNPAEMRRQRLRISKQLEEFLRSRNELSAERLQALYQARFEIARSAWLDNQEEAEEVIRNIEERHPGFVPDLPAAPRQYRWAYRIMGFCGAERLAAWKRHLFSRRADKPRALTTEGKRCA